jgi:putative (di)nucleoside polyphosphate hydrolase
MAADRDPKEYRPCVGVVLFNKDGKVFLGHRNISLTDYVWQFPQGGIDKGEKPRAAALRELQEETGVVAALVSELGTIEDWLYYEFPTDFKHSEKARGRKGQRQRWFAYSYLGTDDQIDLEADDEVEFSEWRWGTLDEAKDLIVPFKRNIYERLACEFAGFANPKE